MTATRSTRNALVLFAWTIVAGILALGIYHHNQHVCNSSFLGQDGCAQVGAAPSFWTPFVPIWLVGLVVLAIVWLVVRPRKRICPACGDDVRRGVTACSGCGHDFAVAAVAKTATQG